MRRLILAARYAEAKEYAEGKKWLANSWRFVQGLENIIGLRGVTVHVLPTAIRHPQYGSFRRYLENRNATFIEVDR